MYYLTLMQKSLGKSGTSDNNGDNNEDELLSAFCDLCMSPSTFMDHDTYLADRHQRAMVRLCALLFVTNQVRPLLFVTNQVRPLLFVTNQVRPLLFVTNQVRHLLCVTNQVRPLLFVTNQVRPLLSLSKPVCTGY